MPDDDAARALIERAEALIDLGRAEQAIEVLASVPQNTPDLVVGVNCALAFAHLKLNQCAASHAAASRAVEAAPTSTEALYWLTFAEPNDALALEHSSRLVELEPQWGPYRALHARMLERNSRSEEAQAEAREAVRLAPDDVFVLNTLGYVLHASDPDEALDAYGRTLDIDPGNTSAREGIAKLKRVDDADESSRLYRGLLETNPERSHYESQLHWTLFGNLFTLSIGLQIVYAAAWLAATVFYTFGHRTAALVCGMLWSLLGTRVILLQCRKDAAKIADGTETSPREVVASAFRRRPVGISIAALSLVSINVTPAAWGAWGLLAPASSWWTAVGVPILIIFCGWFGALVAWITATKLGR